MINIVNTEKRSQIGSRFKNRWSLLSEREIPREEKNLKKNLRSILIDKDNEFCDEVEEEIRKYLPDSEELIEDIKLLINKYSLEIDAINEEGDEEEDNQFDYDFFDIIEDFIKGILILPAIIDWANARNDWRDRVDESFDGIDFNGLENNVQSIKEQFTNLLQTKAVTDILAKLMEQLEEVKNNKDSKEEKLKNAEEQVASLENDKSTIEAQLKEMEMLKGELL
jgi:membrane-associated HD superfamily phosphohydrolase